MAAAESEHESRAGLVAAFCASASETDEESDGDRVDAVETAAEAAVCAVVEMAVETEATKAEAVMAEALKAEAPAPAPAGRQIGKGDGKEGARAPLGLARPAGRS
eukprot:4860427-Pleurochrysis_carterae.AAC.1